MEKQNILYGFEVDLGFFPKKECLETERQVEIKSIQKADYGFTLILYAGFCGDRQIYITNQQYLYLQKNDAQHVWIKCQEKGLNKKKKMEYTAKLSVDKETWV